jgi:membrane protein implicated in regulation of membrane protease activity
MADWTEWLVAAGIVVVLEMFTGTFYLLMIAIGMAAGGFAALAGAEAGAQFVAAAVVGTLATLVLRRSRYGRTTPRDATRDPNVNLDVGQMLTVDAWSSAGTARVMYRGAQWDVELESGTQPLPGQFIIREVKGSRLIVGSTPR